MNFQVGDRVRSLLDDIPGLHYGEYGTIVKLRDRGTPVIEWDTYNPLRHNCDGSVTNGHGWFVYENSQIELVYSCQDFGELPEININELSGVLFGM